jgi:hypothetical protein
MIICQNIKPKPTISPELSMLAWEDLKLLKQKVSVLDKNAYFEKTKSTGLIRRRLLVESRHSGDPSYHTSISTRATQCLAEEKLQRQA